jgi:hypothetical protein
MFSIQSGRCRFINCGTGKLSALLGSWTPAGKLDACELDGGLGPSLTPAGSLSGIQPLRFVMAGEAYYYLVRLLLTVHYHPIG